MGIPADPARLLSEIRVRSADVGLRTVGGRVVRGAPICPGRLLLFRSIDEASLRRLVRITCSLLTVERAPPRALHLHTDGRLPAFRPMQGRVRSRSRAADAWSSSQASARRARGQTPARGTWRERGGRQRRSALLTLGTRERGPRRAPVRRTGARCDCSVQVAAPTRGSEPGPWALRAPPTNDAAAHQHDRTDPSRHARFSSRHTQLSRSSQIWTGPRVDCEKRHADRRPPTADRRQAGAADPSCSSSSRTRGMPVRAPAHAEGGRRHERQSRRGGRSDRGRDPVEAGRRRRFAGDWAPTRPSCCRAGRRTHGAPRTASRRTRRSRTGAAARRTGRRRRAWAGR